MYVQSGVAAISTRHEHVSSPYCHHAVAAPTSHRPWDHRERMVMSLAYHDQPETAFESPPVSLEEPACMDGANDFTIPRGPAAVADGPCSWWPCSRRSGTGIPTSTVISSNWCCARF